MMFYEQREKEDSDPYLYLNDDTLKIDTLKVGMDVELKLTGRVVKISEKELPGDQKYLCSVIKIATVTKAK